MGTVNSSLLHNLHGYKIDDIFYPAKRYLPFPNHSTTSPGNLITELQAIPKRFYIKQVEDVRTYWWVDATFLPFNDSKVVITASAYHLVNNQATSVHTAGIPNGRIFLVNLEKSLPDFHKLKGTSCSTRPKLSPHPSSRFVAYVGTGEVNLIDLNEQMKVYSKQKDISNAAFQCCALSPDGIHITYITKYQRKFDLYVSELSLSHYNMKTVRCHEICPTFLGISNDSVNMSWSPDGKYIAVGHSAGAVFIIDVKTMTAICSNVFHGIIQTEDNLTSITSFDFDPQYKHSIFAIGGVDIDSDFSIKVYIINLKSCEILSTMTPCEDKDDTIDCIKYNPSGDSIAVGLHTLKIVLLSVRQENNGSILMVIDLNTLSLDTNIVDQVIDRKILSLQYSMDGQKLLSSSCDGFVRIFNVGLQVQTLMELCRLKILCLQNVCKVTDLPLPAKIKKFLLRTQSTNE